MKWSEHAVRGGNDPSQWSVQTPWGSRVAIDGGVIPNDYEAKVIAVVRHMRATGYEIREIAEFLRGVGVVRRRGTPLGASRVLELIHGGRRKARSHYRARRS